LGQFPKFFEAAYRPLQFTHIYIKHTQV